MDTLSMEILNRKVL